MASDTLTKIKKILQDCGAWSEDAAWKVQNTWCIKHQALEIVAAAKGIAFDPPQIIESNGLERVAMVVTGTMDKRSEWSVGECSIQNYKAFKVEKMAAYPWAMAEKRAKDRVILKLIGLHGYAYSEDEADEFKEQAPSPAQQFMASFRAQIAEANDEAALNKIISVNKAHLDALGNDDKTALRRDVAARKQALTPQAAE